MEFIIFFNNYQNYSNIIQNNNKNKIKNFYLKYKTIYYFLLICLFLFICIYSSNNRNYLIKFKSFVHDCYNLRNYNITKINKKKPYLSVCLPVFNMENYIEKALLSIINQKFKDFDIIIVNDNSNDSTEKILEKYQLEDNRIRIINHYKNLGVYCSRVDAALNVIGEYIIFMDPDDMFWNPNLFEELFNYNLKYNLDII